MSKHYVVDTNVPIAANGRNTHANPSCIKECVRILRELQKFGITIIDARYEIFQEYRDNLSASGQPGVGDYFFAWLWQNQANPLYCLMVEIHSTEDERGFEEFPLDSDLKGFDRSDRKFVSVAKACHYHPPILNATDSDWKIFEHVLCKYGIVVQQLCPEI